MVTKTQIKKQLKKVNTISCNLLVESRKFDQMCAEYYGEERYGDHDKDQIIDCLDYGQGVISFEEFDKIMKDINSYWPK